MDWSTILLTLRLAELVCSLELVIDTPIALRFGFTRWRWKYLAESVIALPMVLPPTVLGFYVLVALGLNSPLSRFSQLVIGHRLPFTSGGLVVASFVSTLPFAVQPMAATFSEIDQNLINASSILSASRLCTFVRIVFPLSIRRASARS